MQIKEHCYICSATLYTWHAFVHAKIYTGNFELLSDLLSDLKWLSSSVEYGAVYNLFSFYKKFDKEKVPKKVCN